MSSTENDILSVFFCFQIARCSDEFDGSILKQVTKNEEARLLQILLTKAGWCFFKTKFHDTFVSLVESCKISKKAWTYLNGIQRLGNTSTLLNYAFECRSNIKTKVRYIEFNEVEESVENLKTFTMFAEKF